MIRIDADHITFDGDGHAWGVIKAAPPVAQSGSVRSPWFELDRPCDTCGGDNATMVWGRDTRTLKWCPDCLAGRHTFTIEEVGPPFRNFAESYVTERRVSVVPGMILPIGLAYDGSDCIVWDGDGFTLCARGDQAEDRLVDHGSHVAVRLDSPDLTDTFGIIDVVLPPAAVPGESVAVKLMVAQ